MYDIKNLKLFKKLKKLDEKFASKVLEASNLTIELINKKTTINFPNYTNHDIRHSSKIIDTMYELIKDNIDEFNQLELALMIYAGIFHDIGMAVADKEIQKIKNNNSKYLYNQTFELVKENLLNDETLAVQEIIRDAHGKIAYDLITAKYKDYFIIPEYPSISFADDLGLICQSHTESKSFVEKLNTDSVKGDFKYNPQFIAILLRVADILDIDSTRTPLELYKSIDLSKFSDSEWLKNFTIDNTKKIFKKNGLKEVRLEGQSKNIKIHRKLLSYIQWIENELKLALELTSNMKKKYHLKLNTQVKDNIKSVGYTIPDLKLNVDYHAMTNLLMGEAIYGSKDLGFRELLQNSIDACMVKKDIYESSAIGNDNYIPTIEVIIEKEQNQIIIKDNGIGMNEDIIKNYFLNVGKSYYKSTDFLNYKHNYNPIGNFGIGFLSCFMLSDEVKVITKYYDDKYKYTIDLEKDSQYISFMQEEDNMIESGTQIILNYDSVIKAMQYEKSDFEKLLSKFILDNILIDEFDIRVNGEKLKEFYETKKSKFTIDINKYARDIHGTIDIGKRYTEKTVEELFESDCAILYFDGTEIIKINNYTEVDFNKIIKDDSIEYCKIPLLNYESYKKYESYVEAGYMDYDDSINTLESQDEIEDYMYLLLNKNFTFGSADTVASDDSLYIIANASKYNDIDIDNIIKMAGISSQYYSPLFIIEKINLIYKNNLSLLKFKDGVDYYMTSKIYIKNIKINLLTYKQNMKRIDFIYISGININIKIIMFFQIYRENI